MLDLSLVDRVEKVGDDEAEAFTRRVALEERPLCGISSGAAAALASRFTKGVAFEGKTAVVVLPDLGKCYLSTDLFDEDERSDGTHLPWLPLTPLFVRLCHLPERRPHRRRRPLAPR